MDLQNCLGRRGFADEPPYGIFHFDSKPGHRSVSNGVFLPGNGMGEIAIRLGVIVASFRKIEPSFACEIYFSLLSIRNQTKSPRLPPARYAYPR
jgi:hypothetical protein